MKPGALAVALLALTALARPAAAQFTRAPLDRRISVHVRDVALRDALDRIAAAGSFKLSYSSDNLPLDRRVTVWRDTSQVRDVLAELLRPFPVNAVALPDEQVVLAPRPPESRDSAQATVTVLERVVVTGSVAGGPERPLPVALDVVSGRDIERRGQSDLSAVFDGSVPGIWMWDQSPTNMLAHYGSIRGASSFGVSMPKVYVDGIEVANPLLFTQLTPERIERIEVIRGPQGAALYGADAISGVVNIISRQDNPVSDGAHMSLQSRAGVSGGLANTAVQQHTLSARVGSNLRSASGSVGYATSGAFIPEAYSREFRASGNAKVVGTTSTLTASLQFADKNAGVPFSPLLAGAVRTTEDSEPQQLRTYTAGATMTVAPNDIWTVALTGGVDGYVLQNVPSESGPIAFFVDKELRAARGSAMRATMLASAVAHVGTPDRVGGTLTFALEHSTLRDRSLRAIPKASGSGSSDDSTEYGLEWNTNVGFTQQADLAFWNTAYLTAGIRQERVVVPEGVSQFRLLPMVGTALVRDFSGVTAKVRAAYGKGIRSPTAAARAYGGNARRLDNPFLSPEEQAGVEVGFDVLFGSRFGVHVTRFDQLAYGLIQEVMLWDSTSSGPGGDDRYWRQLQNVGRISNEGWEGQVTASLGEFALAGALSTVDSRVQQLAVRYQGDLRPGDRMLGVPARTLTGTASWQRRGVQVSTTIARASDWINYDRLAIAQCILANRAASGACPDATKLDNGPTLRKYWTSYGGNTRLGLSTTFDLRRGLAMTLTGENLLNHQRGEPDSITIVPGRTLTLGIRARF